MVLKTLLINLKSLLSELVMEFERTPSLPNVGIQNQTKKGIP